jgi:hypothetical protein
MASLDYQLPEITIPMSTLISSDTDLDTAVDWGELGVDISSWPTSADSSRKGVLKRKPGEVETDSSDAGMGATAGTSKNNKRSRH